MKKYVVEFKSGGFCNVFASRFVIRKYLCGYPFNILYFQIEDKVILEFNIHDLDNVKEYRDNCGLVKVWQNNL